jgi:hypothetical protein
VRRKLPSSIRVAKRGPVRLDPAPIRRPMVMAKKSPSGAASTDDAARLARTAPIQPEDTVPEIRGAEHPDAATAGMTQMASGSAESATTVSTADDLSELRRRLTDRPLHVPQLGEMKPSSSDRSNSSGWIRF